MRIALFTGTLSVGGAQRQLVLLARALAERGHEVLVVVLFRGGTYEAELSGVRSIRLVVLRGAPRFGALSRGIGIVVAPLALRRLLRRERIDRLYSLLHLPNALAWFASVGSLRHTLVWGLRDSATELPWKRAVPFHFCRGVSASVPRVVSNSRAALEAFDRAGFRFPKASVVPNGIDLDRFRPDPSGARALRFELGVTPAAPLLGIVGRLVPEKKGHEVFLEAAQRLRREIPDACFLVVGDGRPEVRARLRARAEALGLAGCVHWLHARDALSPVYSALSVLACCSFAEGFPNVVCEALACGTPCVVTDVGDCASIVDDPRRVVPPGDPEALARAIREALSCPPSDTRAAIASRFSPAALAEGTLRALGDG